MQGFYSFSRASFMMDFVASAMLLIVPLILFSIWLVKYRQNYLAHKRIFASTGILLFSVVIIFEIDVRINGWRHLAEPSPFYDTWLFPVLYLHLFFAINATFLWAVTLLKAVRNFPNPPKPGAFSSRHKAIARFAASFMVLTSFSGWIFYYMAFVAA